MSEGSDPAVTGFVEVIHYRQIRGWAFLPKTPLRHVEITAELEGHRIGAATANLFRQDLAEQGIGAGDHAFVVNLDRPLTQEELGKVRVVATTGPGRHAVLEMSDVSAQMASPQARPQARLRQDHALPVQKPVFILGAARSGTSAIAQALLRTGWYEGEDEGFLSPLLADLTTMVHNHYAARSAEVALDTSIARAPKAYLVGALRRLAADLCHQLYPSGVWVDKTPTRETVAAAPMLQAIWPAARFVFMRRRAIENILSRQRKFTETTFVEHCVDWADVMSTWLSVRDRLGSSALELDQFELARDPDGAGAVVADFLDLPAHAKARLIQSLAVDRPEMTSDRFAAISDFTEVGWSPDQQVEFMSRCAELMAQFGYSLDRSYFADPTHGR